MTDKEFNDYKEALLALFHSFVVFEEVKHIVEKFGFFPKPLTESEKWIMCEVVNKYVVKNGLRSAADVPAHTLGEPIEPQNTYQN
jgi:hypothetical protein